MPRLPLALFACFAACSAFAEEGWIRLFNGQNLDGWTPKIKGYPAGENFANTFRVEYRFVGEQLPDGPGWAKRNSGAMIHGQAPDSMRVDQDFPVSIEVQFLGGFGTGNRTTANLCTPGTNVERDGKLYTPHGLNSTSKTYHNDQWVTVEIEARGSRTIIHRIDGETVLAYDKPQYDPKDGDAKKLIEANGGNLLIEGGTISLQSESAPVDFRKVEIKALAP